MMLRLNWLLLLFTASSCEAYVHHRGAWAVARRPLRSPLLDSKGLGRVGVRLASTEEPGQEITDLNLEEMFEVFEAADSEVTNEEVGMAAAATTTAAAAAAEVDDDSDAFKQFRVVFYIIISLIPILFLLPFLSSNPLQPLDPELIQSMVEQGQ
jgi:hypothetical protein